MTNSRKNFVVYDPDTDRELNLNLEYLVKTFEANLASFSFFPEIDQNTLELLDIVGEIDDYEPHQLHWSV